MNGQIYSPFHKEKTSCYRNSNSMENLQCCMVSSRYKCLYIPRQRMCLQKYVLITSLECDQKRNDSMEFEWRLKKKIFSEWVPWFWILEFDISYQKQMMSISNYLFKKINCSIEIHFACIVYICTLAFSHSQTTNVIMIMINNLKYFDDGDNYNDYDNKNDDDEDYHDNSYNCNNNDKITI